MGTMQHQYCPDCGGLAVNVQGIEACVRCTWAVNPSANNWGNHPA